MHRPGSEDRVQRDRRQPATELLPGQCCHTGGSRRGCRRTEEPAGTLQECLSLASIKEAPGGESEEQMLRAVIADFEQILSELGKAVEVSENEGDSGTADLFIGMKVSLEKHCWMLKAYLQ